MPSTLTQLTTAGQDLTLRMNVSESAQALAAQVADLVYATAVADANKNWWIQLEPPVRETASSSTTSTSIDLPISYDAANAPVPGASPRSHQLLLVNRKLGVPIALHRRCLPSPLPP
jgi:hypothetical protein